MVSKSFMKFLAACCGLMILCSAQAQTTGALLRQTRDPAIGNPKGKVTVVEFFDYRCSYCVAMKPVIDSIIKSNPNVRVVFKDYPIKGGLSAEAAKAAIAANQQGKYYRFSQALLKSHAPLTPENIFRIAKRVGLNVEQLQKDMKSPGVNNQLSGTIRLAHSLNVYGTPAFFVAKTNAKNQNDLNYFYGSMSQRELQEAINEAASS